MDLSIWDKVLWLAGFLGHALLLLVLLLRHRARKFPVFSALIAFQAMVSVSLFLLNRHASEHTYFLAYWIIALGDYLFQIGLIWEIARDVLRPTGSWVQDARSSFLLWSAVGLLLAAALSFTLHPPGVSGLALWEMRATIFTSLLTCELFLAMLGAANRLGLSPRSHVMALGQGLTAWALVAIVGDLAHLMLGWNRELIVFDRVRMCVYLGALFFWIVAFWLPERERAPLSGDMQDYLIALHAQVQYDLDRIKL